MLPGEYMDVPGEAVQPDGGEHWVALDPVVHVLNNVEYMYVPGDAVQPDGGEDWVALDPIAYVLNDVEYMYITW